MKFLQTIVPPVRGLTTVTDPRVQSLLLVLIEVTYAESNRRFGIEATHSDPCEQARACSP